MYPGLQGYPSPVHTRQRTRKRRVELKERILTEDRGNKTSTLNLNRDKKFFCDPVSPSSEAKINTSSLQRNLLIVQEFRSLVTEKDTVNYMFRHRWNYFLCLLYSDGTNIHTVWTELVTDSKSERRIVIEESIIVLSQEWQVETQLISPVLLKRLRGYSIIPNHDGATYLHFSPTESSKQQNVLRTWGALHAGCTSPLFLN